MSFRQRLRDGGLQNCRNGWIDVKKWSWTTLCTRKGPQVETMSGLSKATNRNWKKIFGYGLNLNQFPFQSRGGCGRTSRLSRRPAKGLAGWKNEGVTSLSRVEITPSNLLKKSAPSGASKMVPTGCTLRENQTHLTRGNAGRVMACLSKLVIGLISTKTTFAYLPPARRFFDVHPTPAFAPISRL